MLFFILLGLSRVGSPAWLASWMCCWLMVGPKGERLLSLFYGEKAGRDLLCLRALRLRPPVPSRRARCLGLWIGCCTQHGTAVPGGPCCVQRGVCRVSGEAWRWRKAWAWWPLGWARYDIWAASGVAAQDGWCVSQGRRQENNSPSFSP